MRTKLSFIDMIKQNTIRASYSLEMVDGVLCLIDLDDGHRSVTNDAARVVEDLAKHYDLAAHPIVYRDTMGRWDGLMVHDGKFDGFLLIGAKMQADAVSAIKSYAPFPGAGDF